MSYFPVFLKFDDKKILIIGGGNIAFEKLVHLLDFTTNIALLSKDFTPKIQELITEHKLVFTQKEYRAGDIKGFDIIIVAIDDLTLQKIIYVESKIFVCLCNCVDLPKYCDFIFPSYIKKGDLTIAISTSGTSPAFAKNLRIYLSKIIPETIIDFLKNMKQLRTDMPKGKSRMKFLDKKARDYIDSWNSTF